MGAAAERDSELVLEAHAALRHRLGADPDTLGIELTAHDRVLTMRGEVPDIATKKRALALAGSVPGVEWIADRLRVRAPMPMRDAAIRDHVRDAFVDEPTFSELAVALHDGKRAQTVLDPPVRRGHVTVEVVDGIVVLGGRVPSLAHKRLAGVLCWWLPGTRDVVNDLEVDPPEQDSDAEIADAVRIVLEKDPFIDAVGIGVTCESGVVTLRGSVRSREQASLAERDAWYTFGVNAVKNDLALAAV